MGVQRSCPRCFIFLACAAGSIFLFASASSEESDAGLLFAHNNGGFGSRGSLRIPESGFILTEAELKLSFDIAIWDPSYFGHVVSVTDTSRFTLALVYAPRPTDPDSADIVLSLNNELVGLAIPVARKDLGRDCWRTVDIAVNSHTKRINAGFRDAKQYSASLPVALPVAAYLLFGSIPGHSDVPPMAIRNVRLTCGTTAGGLGISLRWPLNESEGVTVQEVEGRYPGSTHDTQWLGIAAHGWLRLATIPLRTLSQVALDHRTSTLYVVGKSSLTRFSLESGLDKSIEYTTQRPNPDGGMKVVFNEVRGTLCAYHTGLGEVSLFDESARSWSPIDTTSDHDQRYYDHASFIEPEKGDLYALGGYGWYKAKNTVQRYDERKRKWIALNTRGDESPSPRMSPAVTLSEDGRSLYVCCGLGNKSGEQTAGYNKLTDLWALDLKTATWRKIADSLALPRGFGALGMARVPGSKELVVFGAAASSGLAVRLFAFDPDTLRMRELPELVPPGSPIFTESDYRTDRFVIAVHRLDSFGANWVDVYTLRSTVQPVLAGAGAAETNSLMWIFVIAGVGALALVVTSVARRAKKRHPTRYSARLAAGRERVGASGFSGGTRVRIFGEFMVTDAHGVDRTAEFSPKILELFLLILTHSHPAPTENNRITAERLTQFLWPHSTRESAKNSRGVALKTLRDLLEKLGGLRVQHAGRGYSIEPMGSTSIDYFDALATLGELHALQSGSREDAIRRLLDVTARGEILASQQYTWLPEIRGHLDNAIIAAILDCFGDAQKSANHSLWGRVADLLLSKDPLNESALQVRLRALSAQGHHGKVAEVYNDFAQRYFSTFNSPFERSLRDMLA